MYWTPPKRISAKMTVRPSNVLMTPTAENLKKLIS